MECELFQRLWSTIGGFKEGIYMIILAFYKYGFGSMEVGKEMRRLL